MTNINGYDLSRTWFDWCFENPEKISPNHTALYFFIIEHCNRLGWKTKFGLPTLYAMEAIGVKSKNTYYKAFRDLVDWGFVRVIEKSKNQNSANIISISATLKFKSARKSALDMATIRHVSQHEDSTENIDKPSNHITSKPCNNNHQSEIEELEPEIISIFSFEEFWNMYDRKVGKPKAEKLYAKISEKDRARIKEYVPKYVLATPDKTFRKHPQTFLRNRGWEDEIINRNYGHNQSSQSDKDRERKEWLAREVGEAFSE